jgi:hypothetical protein
MNIDAKVQTLSDNKDINHRVEGNYITLTLSRPRTKDKT